VLSKNLNKQELPITIAHISDFHSGSYYFVPELMKKTVEELKELQPKIIVATGDLTSQGFYQEFEEVKGFLDQLRPYCESMVVVPGNHDARHVGYLHFEDIIASRNIVVKYNGITFVGADSSEPDLDSGRIGRERYKWILESFSDPDDYKIFVLHHHLLPVPGTGRERNIVYDAGDVLQVLLQANVNMVLTGHKHVPYIWRLEDILIINAGTVSSLRLRGRTKPCYNLIEIHPDRIKVFRKQPSGEKELSGDFRLGDKGYTKWIDRVETENSWW